MTESTRHVFFQAKMSQNYKELKEVQQEIKDLLKEEAKLKKKANKCSITDDEKIDLGGINKLLETLKDDKARWFNLVESESKAKLESKTFKNADSNWAESVNGVDVFNRNAAYTIKQLKLTR